MIDQTGKKIVEKKQTKDKNFILAEIRFFMKGFRNERDDKKALHIAETLNEFLKSDGEFPSIMETLLELESYSAQTKSDSFVWELVYIRRLIANAQGKSQDDLIVASECRHISAKHFEKICELRPSFYNKCCRVQEYVTAALIFLKLDDKKPEKSQKNQIISRAEELFSQIEKHDNVLYYETGRYLYYCKYNDIDFLLGNKKAESETITSIVQFALEVYKRNNSYYNLKYLALFYNDYLDCEQFCYPQEEENIKMLINSIENSVEPIGKTLQSILRKLKNSLK